MAREREQGHARLRSIDAMQRAAMAGVKRRRQRPWPVSITFARVALAASIVFFFLIGAKGPVHAVAVVCFLLSFACLWYAWPTLMAPNNKAGFRAAAGEREDIVRRLAEIDAELSRLRQSHERRYADIVASTPTWFGIPIPQGTTRTEVFGGDKLGWEAILATAGGSLLGAGARVVVLDFSESLVSTLFAHIAAKGGKSVSQVFLPEQAGELDVLGGAELDAIVDVVVQSWHGGAVDDRATRVDMNRDLYVLQRICECLAPPPSLARLAAAAEFVLQQSVGRNRSSLLTEEEREALLDTFGSAVRGGMQFTDRLMPLTAYLQNLGLVGSNEPRVRLSDVGANDVTVIALTPQGRSIDKAALIELQVQAMIHQFSAAGPGDRPTHLIIMGSDLLHRTAVQRLHRFSEQVGVALLLFRHRFDEEAAAHAGAGDSTQLFMQLGNRGDAERAAQHIGLGKYFVLGSVTESTGETVTETHGEALTYSHGTSLGIMAVSLGQVPLFVPNVTQTSGSGTSTNTSESTSQSTQRSYTATRVHERFVEPEVLQALPRYVFLWRERDLPPIAGVCDTALALQPGVARELPK